MISFKPAYMSPRFLAVDLLCHVLPGSVEYALWRPENSFPAEPNSNLGFFTQMEGNNVESRMKKCFKQFDSPVPEHRGKQEHISY